MFIKLAWGGQCLGHCWLCARNMRVSALSERTCRPAQSAALLAQMPVGWGRESSDQGGRERGDEMSVGFLSMSTSRTDSTHTHTNTT